MNGDTFLQRAGAPVLFYTCKYPAGCGVSEKKEMHKSHKVIALAYHIFLPGKYRKVVFDEGVEVEPGALRVTRRVFLRLGAIKSRT